MHAISIDNITLNLYKRESDIFGFKKMLLTGKILPEEKILFHDLTLQIEESTILGIEGPNGIGKTTLLAAIAGLIPIKSGSINVKGKVLPLLGLGHIFHPDLNIHRNIELWNISFSSGFKIEGSFVKNIIESCGIDVMPTTLLRSLSSGMKSRLAFELAMRGKEDILRLDEVFSVGDSEFREKSILKMQEKLKSLACAVIVSHDRETLREHCNRIIRIKSPHEIEEVIL